MSVEAPFRTQVTVTGMTCHHCVTSVTEEISEIDGVDAVEVSLDSGASPDSRGRRLPQCLRPATARARVTVLPPPGRELPANRPSRTPSSTPTSPPSPAAVRTPRS